MVLVGDAERAALPHLPDNPQDRDEQFRDHRVIAARTLEIDDVPAHPGGVQAHDSVEDVSLRVGHPIHP